MKRYTVAAVVVITVLLSSVLPTTTASAQAVGEVPYKPAPLKLWKSFEHTVLAKISQSDVPDNTIALLSALRAVLP